MGVLQIIILLLVLVSIIGSYTFYPKTIHKIARKKFPKLLGKIFLIAIALITFIFGIHSETFSSYDKFIVNSSKKYNWFSPEDILKFPIEQYKINTKELYPDNIIDFSKGLLERLPTRKVTILLDKTASVTYNVSQKRKKDLKDTLISRINGSIYDFEKIINNSQLKVEDLYVLSALEKLTREESRDTTHIQVIIYKGSYKKSGSNIPDLIMSINEEYLVYNSKKRNYIILKCLKDLINLNLKKNREVIQNRFTDFYGLAKELKENKYLGKGPNKNNGTEKKFDHTSLFILSDFMHESILSDYSAEDVALSWSGFSNLISQINLISFDSRYSNTKRKGVSSIKESFKENFNHLYFFEFGKNMNSGLTEDEEINVMFSTVVDGKVSKPIILYHSWDKEDYRYDYKGEVIIKKEHSKKLVIGFLDRIRPSNYIKPYTYLTIRRKSKILNESVDINLKHNKLYENQKKHLNGSEFETYMLSFSVDEIESKNFSLEFTYPHISYTVRHPIVFKPVLSTTSSIYLTIFYFLLILSTLHGSLYFLIGIFNDFSKNRLKVLFSIGLLTLIGLSIWLLCCYYSDLIFMWKNDNVIKSIILSSLVLLISGLIINFRLLMNRKKEKVNISNDELVEN